MVTLVNSKDLFFCKSQKWDCYSPSVHQMFTKQIKIHKNKNEMLKTVKNKTKQKTLSLFPTRRQYRPQVVYFSSRTDMLRAMR